MSFSTLHTVGLIISGGATVGFYGINNRFRAVVEDVVAPLKVPERRWGYSATDLFDFRKIALERPTPFGKSALDVYRSLVLLIDIGFAVALACFGILCWHEVAQQAPWAFVSSAAIFGQMAAALYGVFDVGEDICLRILLRPDRSIRDYEARNATVLTRLKFIAITLSLICGLVFLVLKLVLDRFRS